jgi:hypothetical protein
LLLKEIPEFVGEQFCHDLRLPRQGRAKRQLAIKNIIDVPAFVAVLIQD